jgi:hypothetical protein
MEEIKDIKIMAKTIERIAEELGVNFYVLYPLITARDIFYKQEGINEVIELLHYDIKRQFTKDGENVVFTLPTELWHSKLKEWRLE